MADLKGITWTVLGEPYRPIDDGPLCAALAQAYPGLRFCSVGVYPMTDEAILGDRWPDDDLVTVNFSLSGSPEDLVRHRFADPTWWHNMGSRKTRSARDSLRTEGLGHACELRRTKTGFNITGASYDDGLDRIAALFVPQLLLPWRKREP